MGKRILGLDPGLRRTGWGVIEVEGHSLKHVAHGVVSPKADIPMAERLNCIFLGLSEVIDSFCPEVAAVEKTFVNNNPTTTLKLGEARGVVLLAPAHKGLPVTEYTANQIKKAIVGGGHAAKEQVKLMVAHLLPKCGCVTADEADALATAICHAHSSATYTYWKAGVAA